MQHQDRLDEDLQLFRDRKCISNAHDLAEFLKSSIYQDFCYIAQKRKEAIKDDLLHASTIEMVNRLQGEYASVDFWEQFPIGMIKAIEQEREEKENNVR